MKVLAISGSPRPHGNTYFAAHETLKVLEQQGLETEYISLHDKQILPCRACMQCAKEKNRCAQEDDFMPVYEAMARPTACWWARRSISAPPPPTSWPCWTGPATWPARATTPFTARWAARGGGPPGRGQFHLRPAAVLVRHHGDVRARVHLLAHRLRPQTRRRRQDAEGLKTMPNLAENMAWLMKKLG